MQGGYRYFCQTCPYIYYIDREVIDNLLLASNPVIDHAQVPLPCLFLQISRIVPLKRKEIDDVLGDEDAWKNVQKADGVLGSRCLEQ